MVRDITKDDAFADRLEQTVQERQILDLLMAKRAAAELSQQDIADRMNCTQGRISKLENATDAELTIGEFQQYAKSLGLEVAFGIRNRDITIAEQVKLHVFAVRKLLHQLAELSGDDETILSGLKVFLSEVLFNTAVSVEIVNRRFETLVKDSPRDKPPLLAFDSDLYDSELDPTTSA